MFNQLLIYYQGLLILQYAGLPKFQQFIQLVVNQDLCDGLFLQLGSCFNLNTAVGNQLTLIGQIFGVPRNVQGINPYAVYFNFTRAAGEPASIGFNRATTPVDPDFFQRAQVQATYTMTDFEMRSVIQLKIIYNSAYSSFGALKTALYNQFHGLIDIVAPAAANSFFNFTRSVSEPASKGFNRATTPTDSYFFLRASIYYSQLYGSTLMNLMYTVKQPYYIIVQIAQLLKILPHSSGVGTSVTQL
jgi:hypothetical protein